MITAHLLGLGTLIFVATNLDDLLLLIGFFSDPAFQPLQIVAGQFIGILVLFILSVIGASASVLIPPTYLGLFGLAPIVIGAHKLWLQWNGRKPDVTEPRMSASLGRVGSVAVVTIANGGDNIATYVSVFAVHSSYGIGVIGAVFIPLTALWCVLADRLVSHLDFGAHVRQFGAGLLPYVLIGLGITVLGKANSASLL